MRVGLSISSATKAIGDALYAQSDPASEIAFRCARTKWDPVNISGRRRRAHLNQGRYIAVTRDHAPSDFRNAAQDDRSLR